MREIQGRNEVMLHIANNFGVLAKLFAVLAAQSSGVGAWRFYSDHKRGGARGDGPPAGVKPRTGYGGRHQSTGGRP